MIEQINNFANFNLSAILFAVIGGGVFIAIFHYALLPILNIILIKPLVSVVYNTYSFFSKMMKIKMKKIMMMKKKDQA